MVTTTALEAELLRLAGSVPDPELPVLTLEDLGVVRAVHLHGADAVEVELTPTYTGCPAVEAMSRDIERVLREHGMRKVAVRTVLSPAWSTDDITPEGRRKLRESGIAPPRVRGARGPVSVTLGPPRTRSSGPSASAGTVPTTGSPASGAAAVEPVACPHCGSADTELLSRFSSTACKALRRCRACGDPFDHFKEV
ncbi:MULTISPECIES: 1,2-phenylacetyl-CoA epoxidase subunit PaaD [Streptomyces]|uniref:Phenylacetate-CoA oxygenase subunit PaaJ n=1 Tax=Streptomyces thermoviolaceus subsp. thermoviolaceus TaxID=66860 RepID=A0ABX0YXA1_STRTL|nr:1,2-phenylacetyl-CoA epoxidase subunit PaaD [Streptomyces thermoviolaceus]NJP17290.1 phenylacetate-CoA oxygenase subunit PaaJ [Streptomyces thermoviolaceus subsp. thermoviolaceus]WTD48409.1 phenylacetate-CoA oxygenase subunit PaaJ [Streptomyces thermoviolaceus]GHA88250.1 phenylacetate-CoA oxygenase subunit PaaJ [Streptomyces thermoviolaceus subsp. thermoviolaceus]